MCNICGRSYVRYTGLNDHRKKHEGKTTCHLCGKVAPTVGDLRKHLAKFHQLSREEICKIVPTRNMNNRTYHM